MNSLIFENVMFLGPFKPWSLTRCRVKPTLPFGLLVVPACGLLLLNPKAFHPNKTKEMIIYRRRNKRALPPTAPTIAGAANECTQRECWESPLRAYNFVLPTKDNS